MQQCESGALIGRDRCRPRPGSRDRGDRGRFATDGARSLRAFVRGAARVRVPPRMDGLICLQRETDRFAEEWERTRDPRAEGLSALIAIETLRTLALRTMAELGAREEPVPTEDLGRLALALNRIERADRLRIEREQAAADPADAHAGAAARAASMTHAERVETVRRALRGTSSLGAQTRRRRHSGGPPPLPRTLPSPCRSRRPIRLPPPLPRIHGSPRRSRRPIRLPTTGRRMWGTPAGRRMYVTRAGARDSWDAHSARDAELRRREAEGRLWPTDPPFCPAAWSGPG